MNAMGERFDLADTVYLTREFYGNSTGNVADPDRVNLKVRDPEGTETTYTYASGSGTLTRDGQGRYSYLLTADLAGTWHIRWEATTLTPGGASSGAPLDASEESFYVRESATA